VSDRREHAGRRARAQPLGASGRRLAPCSGRRLPGRRRRRWGGQLPRALPLVDLLPRSDRQRSAERLPIAAAVERGGCTSFEDLRTRGINRSVEALFTEWRCGWVLGCAITNSVFQNRGAEHRRGLP